MRESRESIKVPVHPALFRSGDGSITQGSCAGSGSDPELLQRDPTGAPIKITCSVCHDALVQVEEGVEFRPISTQPAIVYIG